MTCVIKNEKRNYKNITRIKFLSQSRCKFIHKIIHLNPSKIEIPKNFRNSIPSLIHSFFPSIKNPKYIKKNNGVFERPIFAFQLLYSAKRQAVVRLKQCSPRSPFRLFLRAIRSFRRELITTCCREC